MAPALRPATLDRSQGNRRVTVAWKMQVRAICLFSNGGLFRSQLFICFPSRLGSQSGVKGQLITSPSEGHHESWKEATSLRTISKGIPISSDGWSLRNQSPYEDQFISAASGSSGRSLRTGDRQRLV